MSDNKLGLSLLTALVVGNMVGSGIFMLPRNLAEVASPAGILLAWILTGAGVLMIALVFGNLAVRKPELTGGPQAYARELVSNGSWLSSFSGYVVCWGYWVANFAGNVAIITTFASYLSTFFPVMTSQSVLWQAGSFAIKTGNFLTFLVCSALLWSVHFLILRGIEDAGKTNFVATTAKVIGFLLFIVVTLFAFEASQLSPFVATRADGQGNAVGILGQVNAAAVSALWAFVGIESAVVLSARARKQSDVKKATILGLILAIAIYFGITFLAMGTLSQEQLSRSEKPLVDALSAVLGDAGSNLLAGLGLISLLGSAIGWILLSAEVPYQAAKQGLFTPQLAKTNRNGTPVTALTITNIMSQLFIFSTISNSISQAFEFVITVATLSYLIPYLLASVYQIKLVWKGETYRNQEKNRTTDGMIAVLATLYSLWVIKAGTEDLKTFLSGVGLLFLGMLFYPVMHKSGTTVEVNFPSIVGQRKTNR